MSIIINKTILIFDQCGQEAIQFYVVEGDQTKFQGVYINGGPVEGFKGTDQDWDALTEDLNTLFYDDDGNKVIEPEAAFPVHLGAEIQAGTCVVAVCGFFP